MIFKPTTSARIISHLSGDYNVIIARKIHQTRSKIYLFEALTGRGLIPYHSDSEPGGPCLVPTPEYYASVIRFWSRGPGPKV